MKRLIPNRKRKVPKTIEGKRFVAVKAINKGLLKPAPTREDLVKIAHGKGLQSTRLLKLYHNIGDTKGSSRQAKFYKKREVFKVFLKFRKVLRNAQQIPSSYRYFDHEYLMKRYALKGVEFGSWLSQEDRYNYTCAIGLVLYDLRRITGIKDSSIGLNLLSVCFGSRGRGSALAHFSGNEIAINTTRYREDLALKALRRGLLIPRTDKVTRQIETSGINSFAHEFGHYVDFIIAQYIEKKDSVFASENGNPYHTISKSINQNLVSRDDFSGDFERFFRALFWTDSNNKKATGFIKKMEKMYPSDKAAYFHRRVELWARCFEQWVYNSLKDKGIYNEFLQPKYERIIYPDAQLAKKLDPFISKIMKRYAKEINQYS